MRVVGQFEVHALPGLGGARLNRPLKKSRFYAVRVELAFRLASKCFIFDSESASADGTTRVQRLFQRPLKSCPDTSLQRRVLEKSFASCAKVAAVVPLEAQLGHNRARSTAVIRVCWAESVGHGA